MRRIVFTSLALIVSFFLGFEMRTMLPVNQPDSSLMRKVTGIGGIFFKRKGPEKI